MYAPVDDTTPLRRLRREMIPQLQAAVCDVFEHFPAVAGIITRIGECDGLDVQGDFKSRLVIKKPAHARKLLEALLPVFERHDRLLIFRTWTVGAYPIGDLMWNRDTFYATFKDLDSEHLVLSMKYGESDFFRYLPVNKNFFRTSHRKIVELQTRREYEGFGEYPSFVGWDYEKYIRELDGAQNVIGACIWCQTGGWSTFNRLTFLEDSSVWNEINTYVTLKLCQGRSTTEEAVRQYCNDYLHCDHWWALLTLLRLSDEVVKELLYIDDFARRKIFFRRLRVPSLLAVYWDHVIINHPMRKLMRCFVDDRAQKISQGYAALRKINTMKHLAQDLSLPAEGLTFEYDTFEILAVAREYYFGPFSEELAERIRELKKQYRRKYHKRYSIHLDFSTFSVPRSRLNRVLALLLRYKRGYRVLDRIFMIRILSVLAPILRLHRHRYMPDFIQRQAMGLDTVLK
jgi:hypothetical protein